MAKGANIGNAILWLKGDDSGLDKTLKGALKKTLSVFKTMRTAANDIARKLSYATVAFAGYGVKAATDFDTAMREVNTLLSISDDEFRQLSENVLALSSRMGVDATASAEALYQAISASVPKENAISFLEVATKSAIAGVTDTETAVDGLTTVLNAFKIPASEVERVADLMFTTVKGGKTTLEELAKSLFNVAPIAASANVKFEDVSAAISSITKQGVPTAIATTQIRAAIQALIKPTADMEAAFKAYKIENGSALLANQGLAGSFDMIAKMSGGSQTELAKMMGSVEGLSAVLSLTGSNAQMFQADLEAMRGSTGATQTAFEKMEESASRRFQKLFTSVKNLSIQIGNALLPHLERMASVVLPWVAEQTDWLSKHQDEIQQRYEKFESFIRLSLGPTFKYFWEEIVKPIYYDVLRLLDAWDRLTKKMAEGVNNYKKMSAYSVDVNALRQKTGTVRVSPGINTGVDSLQSEARGSGGVSFSMAGATIVIREQADINRIADELGRRVDRSLRARGALA